MSRSTVLIDLLILLTVCRVVAGVTCKDMNGNDVDWYYGYKLPNMAKKWERNDMIRRGVALYYMDNTHRTFQLSGTSVEETSQPIAQTLLQIYNGQPTEIAYIMYSDQPPPRDANAKPQDAPPTRGHAKGVVAFDNNAGFWMIHSIPKFPKKDRYEWTRNASRYGQSILCVSFKISEMEKIAKQMLYIYPYVYESNLPNDKLLIAPTFADVVKREQSTERNRRKTETSHIAYLESLRQNMFTHYAKNRFFEKDLYLHLVAKNLQSKLFVETWRQNSSQTPPVYDQTFASRVEDVTKIQFPSLDLDFRYTKDHSKWAVSDDSKQVICVGDINRQMSQYKRGGGTLCANLPNVWLEYYKSVVKSPSRGEAIANFFMHVLGFTLLFAATLIYHAWD